MFIAFSPLAVKFNRFTPRVGLAYRRLHTSLSAANRRSLRLPNKIGTAVEPERLPIL